MTIIERKQKTKAELVAEILGLLSTEVQVLETENGWDIRRVRMVRGKDGIHLEPGKQPEKEPTFYMVAEDIPLSLGQEALIRQALEGG